MLNPDMPAQELRLHMGELTPDEIRVARAAIRWANSAQEVKCVTKINTNQMRLLCGDTNPHLSISANLENIKWFQEKILELCDAYDEVQKEIEILAKVVVHYAFLEVNDNGDYNYPANKALTQLGYSEEHKFEKVEKS